MRFAHIPDFKTNGGYAFYINTIPLKHSFYMTGFLSKYNLILAKSKIMPNSPDVKKLKAEIKEAEKDNIKPKYYIFEKSLHEAWKKLAKDRGWSYIRQEL
ncbi:MAG: hypothetical protein ACD_20C00402G0001 [uncultured bacterium]|nr:MAG: hypothetical protein ACD_20C00402G0001 [uncultured bacterium]HBH17467.1 hypothetical protein [Cyanobacteria bacterium UBA9579]